MELRGSLGRSVRLFLQRNAVDSVETGSKRRHLSSTSAVVAPLIARQGLEVRLLYDLRHSGSHVCFLIATHVMKMMAHRQRRRMSLASVAWGDSSAATRVTALMWDRLQVSDSCRLTRRERGSRERRLSRPVRAREQQADKLFREIIEIADDASGIYVTTGDSKRTVSRRCGVHPP